MSKSENVTLYSQPGCGGCIATKRAFKSKEISYNEVDITKDSNAAEYVTKKLGYKSLPVVELANGNHWSGFDPEEIAKIKQ